MSHEPRFHDLNAERTLIGAAMLDESVVDRVALHSMAFANAECRCAWQAIQQLHADGKPLDAVLVGERSEIPPSTLAAWLLDVPTADNAEYYADIVRNHAMTRGVLWAADKIRDLHRRGQAEGLALLDAALEEFTALDVGLPQRALTIGDLIKERFAELDSFIEARARGEDVLTGVPTGLEKLDKLLSGIQPGIVTMLAGRPAMGKSALALGIADVASQLGYGVHVFSLEDARASYTDRALARGARVPTERIRTARLRRDDMLPMNRRASELCKRSHWLYEDISDISADEIVRAVRRARVRNKTRLVIVDYLQIVRRPRRYENKNDVLEQNINTLARAARHDNIAYLVLSQLSREVERRDDKRPRMSDLRDSGTLEERTKCVLAVYRGHVYGEPREGIDYDENDPKRQRPTQEEWERRMDILILKNSHGPTGTVGCQWDGPCTRVY